MNDAITQKVGATADFAENFFVMREANTKGADKYFHSKANCEAAQRGFEGVRTSKKLSDAREFYGEYIKGDPYEDRLADETENAYGGNRDRLSKRPCSSICDYYKPNGLDEKY